MNDLQKMLAKMFPQSEQSVAERAYTLAYGQDPRDREDYDPRIGYDFFRGEQFNIADVIREANLSPEEYDKFIDLAKKNRREMLKMGRDPREVADIFSRIFNPDNRTSQLPDNTKRRMPVGVDQGFGNFQILAEVLAGRESSPSLEKSPRSKSIDDILKESDVAEFLSKADRDVTNVDAKRQKNMEASTVEQLLKMFGETTTSNTGRMDRQTLQEIINMQEPVPQDTSGVGRMDINTLMEILRMQEPVAPR